MTAVAKVEAPSAGSLIKAEIYKHNGYYERLLPKGYAPERLMTGAMVAIQANPLLLKCDPKSIALSLARIAQWGLDIGDTAHLVPYGTTCTPIPDYKGLIKLMLEAGARRVEAHEVYEGDFFEYELGAYPVLRHRPVAPGARGKLTHAYACVTLRGGAVQIEVMFAEEIDALRQQHSKQWKNGALTPWYARKTVLRRASKYVPRTARLSSALDGDEQVVYADATTGEILPPPAPAKVLTPPQEEVSAHVAEVGDAA